MLKRRVLVRYVFNPIEIGKREEEKRRSIRERDGEFVLLSDFHFCGGAYVQGVLRVDEKDEECYYADLLAGDSELRRERFHYHDLIGLMEGDGKIIFDFVGKLHPINPLYLQD